MHRPNRSKHEFDRCTNGCVKYLFFYHFHLFIFFGATHFSHFPFNSKIKKLSVLIHSNSYIFDNKRSFVVLVRTKSFYYYHYFIYFSRFAAVVVSVFIPNWVVYTVYYMYLYTIYFLCVVIISYCSFCFDKFTLLFWPFMLFS